MSDKNKKNLAAIVVTLSLMLLTCIIYFITHQPPKTYTVIHLINADKFYIDFNRNHKPDIDELVKLSAVNALRPSFSSYYDDQREYIGIDKPSAVLVGRLANLYAEQNLLYKDVRVDFVKEKFDDGKDEYRFAKIYLNGKDWGEILLDKGFATVYRKSINKRHYLKYENTYQIKENAKQELAKNYVIVNLKTEKYHKLTCKYGQAVKDFVIVKYDELPKFYQKCNFCYNENEKENQKQEMQYFKNFDITSGSIAMYFTDFTHHLKPSNNLEDENSRALIKLIANAQKSIDIAAYGIDDNDKIIGALINAQKRGVKIRIVADKNAKGISPYKTTIIEQKIGNVVYDNVEYADSDKKEKTTQQFKNALMHNKFLIFDNKIVYTGSLNIAKNDLSGYNSNVSLVINSEAIAHLYEQEFEQMYKKKFHNFKQKIYNKEGLQIDKQNIVSVYFSPQDKIVISKLTDLINFAQKYVYVPIFSFTNKELMTALENAYERGVDVKVITDAANASERFAPKRLRNSGIAVKVENYAGKMHMKALIVDDKYVAIGSMNFSNAGQNANDENMIIIENPVLAENFKNQFLYTFSKIDNKWLKHNPGAETRNSLGACEDGVDNDFDGLVDSADDGCKAPIKRY